MQRIAAYLVATLLLGLGGCKTHGVSPPDVSREAYQGFVKKCADLNRPPQPYEDWRLFRSQHDLHELYWSQLDLDVSDFTNNARSTRVAILSVTAIIAIVAGLALREDYRVSRAETCFRFLQGAAQRGNEHGALIGYGRGGGRLVSIGPGHIRTKYGTPPELVAYLKRKHNGWFSGTIIACRNHVFGFTVPNPEELSKVESMPVPGGIEETYCRTLIRRFPFAIFYELDDSVALQGQTRMALSENR